MNSDDEVQPRRLPETKVDADGWNSLHPHWRERIDTTSALALAVEALRRISELRDLLAEDDSPETVRALMLNNVIYTLYEVLVSERAGELGTVRSQPIGGSGADLVGNLYDAGILSRTEYRPIV